jgi:hypothetical protein
MTTDVSVVKSGLAIAIAGLVAVTAVGCSKNTSSTGASSATSATSSPAVSTVTSTASTPATASAPFVGHWQRHQSTLDITPTTATLFAGLGNGPCSQGTAACSEIDTLAVAFADNTQLTLSVTGVNYGLKDGQTTSVNPSPGPSTAVGDSIQLVLQAPGLLKQTVVKGFPGWEGELYWCGAGVSQTNNVRCGA